MARPIPHKEVLWFRWRERSPEMRSGVSNGETDPHNEVLCIRWRDRSPIMRSCSLVYQMARPIPHNEVVFSCVSDGDIYTGTVADFSGMDPIIYRESLQTEQYDSMSLNGECSPPSAPLRVLPSVWVCLLPCHLSRDLPEGHAPSFCRAATGHRPRDPTSSPYSGKVSRRRGSIHPLPPYVFMV
jgi:hypothetical protein